MLFAEIILLCALFFIICYCNTGGDEKNLKSFSSYPDEIQAFILKQPTLRGSIKRTSPWISFFSNIVLFTVILFLFGIFIRQETFRQNFILILILGQTLNLFDFAVIDMLWWRNSARIRFTGTEHLTRFYKNPKKHFMSFLKGILVFFIVAVIDGLLLSIF